MELLGGININFVHAKDVTLGVHKWNVCASKINVETIPTMMPLNGGVIQEMIKSQRLLSS
jgi:uncharacterized protein (DUF1919 family)